MGHQLSYASHSCCWGLLHCGKGYCSGQTISSNLSQKDIDKYLSLLYCITNVTCTLWQVFICSCFKLNLVLPFAVAQLQVLCVCIHPRLHTWDYFSKKTPYRERGKMWFKRICSLPTVTQPYKKRAAEEMFLCSNSVCGCALRSTN